jgi:ribonuclease BN (tRNA processing enzyme)
MQYITIGSGTAIPQSRRSAPCHLVKVGGQTIVVDLGPGSIWGLVRRGGVNPPDIGLLLFTHLHMDHCADLAPLLFALRSRELARSEPLIILGPHGLHEHYRNLQATWEHRVDPAGFDLAIEEWTDGSFSWSGCIIDAAPTSHSIPNLAWRIDVEDDGGCGIVVTGDGQSTDELTDLASSADHVLVADSAASPGEFLDGHMNPAQAGELARKCGSVKLILSHINPGPESGAILKEAMAHFEGEIVVAEDGMEIEIG